MNVSKEFIESVKALRKAQKEYFRTRSTASLTKAKRLEREVDDMLAQIDHVRMQMEPVEGRLFG